MIPSHLSDLPHRSEHEQQSFFELVEAQAHDAERARGAQVHDIAIAGQNIRLVFAGDALAPALMPALSHRRTAFSGSPDLVLHVWDSASTGVAISPPPVAQHCFSDRGDIWTFHSPRFRSAFHWSEYSLNLLDLDRGVGVFWIRSAEGLPYWTQASPFRSLFHWWMEKYGAQLVHAAAVGTRDGGLLITGKGGVGKSTTALTCLAAGFDYVGDDYVLLTGGEAPAAHSLYRTAKVNPADMGRFARFHPRLLGAAAVAGEEKAVIFLEDDGPGSLVASLPIKAVLTPRFGSAPETHIETIDKALLIGAATYTTLAQLPHAGQKTADFIEAQLRRVPGYSLVLGHDVERVPEALAALLQRAPTIVPPLRETDDAAPAPLISVIIPVYNGAHFLPDAVATVLAQNYPKLEIIVVDDGSSDAIEKAVAALPVQVRFLRQVNSGAAAARNLGIRAASGDLIAMLDVDDLWPAGKLEASLALLKEEPDTDVVMGWAQLMEQSSDDGRFSFVGSPAETFIYYIGSALFRRRAFSRNGFFDPLLRLAEDTDWFANTEHTKTKVARIDMVTLCVRRHLNNTTRGKTGIELVPLQMVRNSLLRKRGAQE